MTTSQRFPHVYLLNLASGQAIRWHDQEGKLRQASTRRLGLTNSREIAKFMRDLSERLCFEKRARLLGLATSNSAPHSVPQEPQRPSVPLAELLPLYLEQFTSRNSLRNQRGSAALLQRLWKKPLREMTDRDVVAIHDEVNASGVAPSTAQLRRQQIAQMLRWLSERDHVEVSDKALKALTRSPRTKQARDIQVLSVADLARVRTWMRANAPEVIATMLDVQLLTGCRVDEVDQLDIAWVDGERINLPGHATKTRTSRAVTFDISPMLREILGGLQGTPFARKTATYRRWLRSAGEALGIDVGGTHTIRRTSVSAQHSAGLASPLALARRAGHSLQMADTTYCSVYAKSELGAGETIEAVLKLV